MNHVVVLTQRAEKDLNHYYSIARKNAPETALRWLNRFEIFLRTLSDNPERCSLAPEDNLVKETIRQLFFGKGVGRFRVLFTIRNDYVFVLHIRRGTMDKANIKDIK